MAARSSSKAPPKPASKPPRKAAASASRTPAGNASSEALDVYHRKRDFERTPEPAGAQTPPVRDDLSFVVQMHHASRLHYDFRLEADGVLKSWAIPKGPSFDTADKRLAMHVEDHPFDYRDFEGIIPKGNYGAGEVVVWDRGTYRLLEGTSATEQIAKGSLKFELHGEKLHGAFALVHIKGRGDEENAWLLIKERDEFVDPAWRIEDHPASVISGKTLADFAADPSAPHWKSNRPPSASKPRPARAVAALPDIRGPMLAVAAEAPFDDPKWLFEIKWDGYRAIAFIERDGGLRLLSRNGNDLLAKFPELADLAQGFSERPVIVDGELAVLDAEGRASFGKLQERLDRMGRTGKGAPVTFIAFDLLYGNGRDMRGEPLETRKAALEAILTGKGPVMYSKHVVGEGKALFELARSREIEGIIGKRRDSKYVERRSPDWVKLKTLRRQEFVIGGWTESERRAFRGLLLGYYDGGEFVFAGAVGSGFDAKKLAAISARLRPLERATPAYKHKPKTETRAHWVRPELVAEISFTEWTPAGILRHPVFLGFREDKAAHDVVREPGGEGAVA